METLSEIRPGGFEFRTRCIGLKPDFFIANGDVIYADSRCAEHELLYMLGELDKANVSNLPVVATDVYYASQMPFF